MKNTCYLFGSKGLLLRCYQILIDHGFIIKAIVSDDRAIQKWSGSTNCLLLKVDEAENLIDHGPVDYLFSINHLHIVPANILTLARVSAINIHDAILPGYAGLNATPWVIYNQEPKHGVTWHEMTPLIDQGDIVKQQSFEIAPNETSYTLYNKCYEAALSTFQALVDDISNNNYQKKSQLGSPSTVYRSNHRMPAMAILNWNEPAAQLDAMVRCLDFGPIDNPLNLAKLMLNDRIYYVSATEVLASHESKFGTLLSITPYLEVATKENVLRIRNIRDADGNEFDLASLVREEGLKIADQLPNISPIVSEEITLLDRAAASVEATYRKRLFTLSQFTLSQLTHSQLTLAFRKTELSQTGKNAVERLHQKYEGSIDLEQILILFFARLNCQENFDIFLDSGAHAERRHLIDPCVPVNFSLEFENSIQANLSICKATIAANGHDSGFTQDFKLRLQSQGSHFPVKTIVLSTLSEVAIDVSGAELIIQFNQIEKSLVWIYALDCYTRPSIESLQSLLANFVENSMTLSDEPLSSVTLLSNNDYQKIIHDWNDTELAIDGEICIHQLFEKQALLTPEAIAISHSRDTISYAALNERANAIAHQLLSVGVKPNRNVGLLVDRSANMIAALLGILKSGAAYLPLDPSYPKQRIIIMLEDAQSVAIISQSDYSETLQSFNVPKILIDRDEETLSSMSVENPNQVVTQKNIAYMIYTSGSTGKPKGVRVSHHNVINFFAAMDQHIPEKMGVWLAVTSISFDISVLELFWTICSGYEIALYDNKATKKSVQTDHQTDHQIEKVALEFSLFYWNVANDENEPVPSNHRSHPRENEKSDAYELLLEGAKYADENHFKAVWTPERHFNSFGGIFPNSAISSAAVATITKNIDIRAGSCVIPLHHPIRVAEDWAMVDNLSQGRVGISVAAGWQPNDFVLRPENHANAKEVMFESLETLQKLWRGETLTFPGPNGKPVSVKTLPRPVQKELPIWITAASSPETFRKAGELGAGVLTHLLGQSIKDVEKNIKIYQEARVKHGHDAQGQVTLMLHTLVGENEERVKTLAREPMKRYLKSAMFLVKSAAWNFPAFKAMSEKAGKTLDEFFETISDEDMDDLLEFAFERYYTTSGLFGTPEKCLATVNSLKKIGVNEIACLVDFGLETDLVLENLPHLNTLRKLSQKKTLQMGGEPEKTEWQSARPAMSIAEIIKERAVTHLQCTPSMASILLADEESERQISTLKHLLIGGERMPETLAKKLASQFRGRVNNMYGPTETTIWSTTKQLNLDAGNNGALDGVINGATNGATNIGRPLANTQIFILDKFKHPVPIDMPGEIHIAGMGVALGYHQREELTDQKFIDHFCLKNEKMFATGDLAKYTNAGEIDYLGRLDDQVKIRGHRIELGEIETQLMQHSAIAEAIVVVQEGFSDDKRLAAYIVPTPNGDFSDKLDVSVIKQLLQNQLPDYMIPAHYHKIGSVPLTPNGKLDRNALSRLNHHGSGEHQSSSYEKPENKLQESVIGLWQQSLGITDIGLDDNFFDIGGHSLLVVEVLSGLRKLMDQPVRMTDMFRFPTVRKFCDYVSAGECSPDSSSQSTDSVAKTQERVDMRKNARNASIARRRHRQNKH